MLDPSMHFLTHFQKDKAAWAQFLAWLNKLDAETIRAYDAAKDYNEWLLAKGGRNKVQEIIRRLTKEE